MAHTDFKVADLSLAGFGRKEWDRIRPRFAVDGPTIVPAPAAGHFLENEFEALIWARQRSHCAEPGIVPTRVGRGQTVADLASGNNNTSRIAQWLPIQEARVRVLGEHQIAERFQLLAANVMGEGCVLVRIPNL